MKVSLMKCPKCGGGPYMQTHEDNENNASAEIHCTDCGYSTGIFFGEEAVKVERLAAERWNGFRKRVICKFCCDAEKDDVFPEPLLIDKMNIFGNEVIRYITLDGDALVYTSDVNGISGEDGTLRRINYCPICGRKLKKDE